jgi:hypothetical protein
MISKSRCRMLDTEGTYNDWYVSASLVSGNPVSRNSVLFIHGFN